MGIRLMAPILCCSLAAPAGAQVVGGTVVVWPGGEPVEAAEVRLLPARGDTLAAVTDSAGGFVLRPRAAGSFRLSAGAAGMQAVISDEFALESYDSLDVYVRLSADSVLENAVEIVPARRLSPSVAAFYRRVEQDGFGWFVTRAQIDDRHARRTSDLLRGAPGISVHPARFGYAVRGRGGCAPTVYVDGTRVNAGAASIDVWTRPEDLEGIEVYSEATAPAEYGGRGALCSVILLWTRNDL